MVRNTPGIVRPACGRDNHNARKKQKKRTVVLVHDFSGFYAADGPALRAGKTGPLLQFHQKSLSVLL
jgi:hypothetical protein